jgi:sugar phosphate isomerase/epimerase
MTIKSFEPQFMRVGVLTAALQELTPRDVRDQDPDRAIEDWAEFAAELGVEYMQLSTALHPTETDVPPEAMLDPVANTLDLREPFNEARARRVRTALETHRIGLSDIGYFDNLLHHDSVVRAKKHDFMRRIFDAAALLGVDAVCGFVGRNQQLSMEENLRDFENNFIPLLKDAKERGITFRVEQCPMPGWTVGDNFHNNIAYTPAIWIALFRICERHGVGDQFRIHYDPSHAILMGQDTRSMFQYLKDEGYNFLIGGFHVKGQVIDAKGVAAWGYGGQTIERGDWKDGKPSDNPADQVNAWKKQTILCEHELPGTARHDPLAYLQNRTVDWLDHQLAAREILALDVSKTHLVVEHEFPPARFQDRERLKADTSRLNRLRAKN